MSWGEDDTHTRKHAHTFLDRYRGTVVGKATAAPGRTEAATVDEYKLAATS